MRMLLEGDNNLMNKEEDSEVVAAVLVASWKRGEIMLETQFSETLGLAPLRGDLSCRKYVIRVKAAVAIIAFGSHLSNCPPTTFSNSFTE